MEKITIEQLTESDFAAAREIIEHVVEFQTLPPEGNFPRESILSAIINQAKNEDGKIRLQPTVPSTDTSWELCYCGVFWSWWLARSLIAAQWGCKLDMTKLGLLYAFCRDCPIILQSQDKKHLAYVKPTKIKWNIAGETAPPFKFPIYELHSDGESTVECLGLKEPLYHWHNVRIPTYMGSVKSAEWKSEWIVTEENTEIRRILLRVIPRKRLLEELKPETIDTWREYVLYQVKLENAPTPVNLLKMICPSTDHEHILRVPYNLTKAEAAITWCNHGIHPDEFVTQH